MKFSPSLPAIVWIAALSTTVKASDRFFFDSFGISPNGRYRIDAKSPENHDGNGLPCAAANFTYTLTDTTTQKTLWQRKQPMTRAKGNPVSYRTEDSPLQVFVNDDGLVAAHLSEHTLLFLDPADGQKRGDAKVLKAFPESQQQRFVRYTSAGSIWEQSSEWFFLPVPAADNLPPATYFVIRPFWNHRLVIDVATAKHVDLGNYASVSSADALATAAIPIKRILTCTIAEETRRALAAVAAAPQSLINENDFRAYWEIYTGFHTIDSLELTDAGRSLHDLETGFGDTDNSIRELRAKLRQTLRSAGKTPAPGHGVILYPRYREANSIRADMQHPYRLTAAPAQRIANAPKLTVGMSAKEFTDLIGCPDAEVSDGGRAYDYDIDAATPYTVRLVLSSDFQSIESIKIITPLAFLHDPARQRAN